MDSYYINLLKDTDKNIYMATMLREKGYHATRIDAVYGKELSRESISTIYNRKSTLSNVGRDLTNGEIGCVLSHIKALKLFLKSEKDYGLFLEDDVEIQIDETQVKNLINSMPSGWEILLLGHHPKYTRTKGAAISIWNRYKYRDYAYGSFVERPLGAYSYVLNRSAAKKIINDFQLISYPFDWWNCKDYFIVGLVKPAVFIAKEFSDTSNLSIERGRVSFSRNKFQSFKDRIRLILEKLGLINIYFLITRIINQILKN